MYKFVFNNKNSFEDMKSVVIGQVNFPMIREKTESINISGRKQGSLTIKTGEYDDLKLSLKLKLVNMDRYEAFKVEVQEWLENIKDNKLFFMNNPQYCYIVKIVEYDSIAPKLGQQAVYNITFICEPFMKLTHDDKRIIQKGSKVQNIGFLDCEPIINLTLPNSPQTIQIDINGEEFRIDGAEGNITINTPLLQIIGEKHFKSIGNFPTLKKGVNTINWTGNITKFEIIPNMLFRG